MPITVFGATSLLVPNLVASTLVGTDVPKLSAGVANGLTQWVSSVSVSTVDAGSAGVGTGLLPLVVPQPVLLTNLTLGFNANALLGIFSPLLITGLANGLAQIFLQGLIKTTHVSVGTGVGTARFQGPPAVLALTIGFKAAGMVGDSTERLANAMGQALDQTFASLIIPVPIVGSASPSGASGTGFGKIV